MDPNKSKGVFFQKNFLIPLFISESLRKTGKTKEDLCDPYSVYSKWFSFLQETTNTIGSIVFDFIRFQK